MTSKTKTKRYGAYHRVSQENGRDADSALTVEDAWRQIDAWGQMRGINVDERYLDWDRTGSKMSRPELDRMLADLKAGVIDGIVVAQVDRFSRADVGDALRVVKDILDITPNGLVLLDLGIDPSTEFGEFGLTILLGLSRMQWRRYKRQWTSAQARAIKKGKVVGRVEFGYSVNGSGTRTVDERWGPVVSEAFKVAATEGMHAAMAYLKREVPHRRWRTDDVRKLLRSRVYLGEARIGDHENLAAHKPLTTPAIWQAAQTEPRSRRTNGAYPLTGLLACGSCGAPLVGAWQTTPDGRRYRRMRCSAVRKGCVGSITADPLEAHVRAKLKAMLASRDVRQRFDVGGIEDAQAALDHAQARLEAYLGDLETQDRVSAAAWKIGVDRRQDAVDEALARRDALSSQAQRVEVLPLADELDDDEALRLAVTLAVDELGPIVVAPGRGTVADRVPLDHLNG